MFNTVEAQDSLKLSYEVVSDNIDSLISDSLHKEFIQAHPPLTASQLSKFKRAKVSGAYGNYVTSFIDSADFYKVNNSPLNLSVSFRKHRQVEWIFYYLVFLFLLLALVQVLFPSYLVRSLRAFANPSSVNSTSRDFYHESILPSFFLGILFLLSTSFLIYLYTKKITSFSAYSAVQLISAYFFFILNVYIVKFIFLKTLSWIFNQRDSFNKYLTLIFSMNELIGIIFLLITFLISLLEGEIPSYVLSVLSIIIVVIYLFRVFGAFIVFSRQTRIRFLEFLLSYISIEVLPTLVLWKFIHDELIFKLELISSWLR
jgi:hypothetical protein